jgi:hypothetical protein
VQCSTSSCVRGRWIPLARSCAPWPAAPPGSTTWWSCPLRPADERRRREMRGDEYIQTYIHTYIHTHIRTYVQCTYIHTYTHNTTHLITPFHTYIHKVSTIYTNILPHNSLTHTHTLTHSHLSSHEYPLQRLLLDDVPQTGLGLLFFCHDGVME